MHAQKSQQLTNGRTEKEDMRVELNIEEVELNVPCPPNGGDKAQSNKRDTNDGKEVNVLNEEESREASDQEVLNFCDSDMEVVHETPYDS